MRKPDAGIFRHVLKDADIPGKEPADIIIPLTESGEVLINWPKAIYAESFNHMSYYYLILPLAFYTNMIAEYTMIVNSTMVPFTLCGILL